MFVINKSLKIFSAIFLFISSFNVLKAYPAYCANLRDPSKGQTIYVIGDIHSPISSGSEYNDSEKVFLYLIKKCASEGKKNTELLVEYEPARILLKDKDVKDISIFDIVMAPDSFGDNKLFIRDLYEGFNKDEQFKDNFSLNYVARPIDAFNILQILGLFPNLLCNFFVKKSLAAIKLNQILDHLSSISKDDEVLNIIKEIKNLLKENFSYNNFQKLKLLLFRLGLFSFDEIAINKIASSNSNNVILYVGGIHAVRIARILQKSGFILDFEISSLSFTYEDLLHDDYDSFSRKVAEMTTLTSKKVLDAKVWSELEESIFMSNNNRLPTA